MGGVESGWVVWRVGGRSGGEWVSGVLYMEKLGGQYDFIN